MEALFQALRHDWRNEPRGSFGLNPGARARLCRANGRHVRERRLGAATPDCGAKACSRQVSMLMSDRRHFQARAVEPSYALAFDGAELNLACKQDPAFGYGLLYRLLGVVARRLQATRLRLVGIHANPDISL